MRPIILLVALAFYPCLAAAEDFSFTFQWGDIPLCKTGSPNTVPNPIFELNNVPEGTQSIRFVMVDKDAPGYHHGGGVVEYNGQMKIAPGVFEYQSPCPPGGVHNYRWTAKAKAKLKGKG